MRISFDVDGVLADMTSSVVRRANRLWPGKFPYGYNMQCKWNFADVLSPQEWDYLWNEFMHVPDFWCELAPFLSEIQQVTEFLAAHKPSIEPFFITSRKTPKTAGSFSAEQQTRCWLNCVGLGAYAGEGHIIVTSSGTEKANAVHRLRIRFHIDDLVENVMACSHVPGHHSFLLNRPWNQHIEAPNAFRVSMKKFLWTVGAVTHAGRFD